MNAHPLFPQMTRRRLLVSALLVAGCMSLPLESVYAQASVRGGSANLAMIGELRFMPFAFMAVRIFSGNCLLAYCGAKSCTEDSVQPAMPRAAITNPARASLANIIAAVVPLFPSRFSRIAHAMPNVGEIRPVNLENFLPQAAQPSSPSLLLT